MVYSSINLDLNPNYMMLITSTITRNNNNMHNTQCYFECKTCNRQFSSFQALGGHRASHKKPKKILTGNDEADELVRSPPPPKIHKCSVCGLEFDIGQALGGHMRRHRDGGATKNENRRPQLPECLPSPVVRKSNRRRVLCLDLNLTPLENDVEFQLGHKVAPTFW